MFHFFMVVLQDLMGKNYQNENKGSTQHTLQRIWAIGLMESWFCIWDDLANPKIGLNLVPNPL
jgi:hypothetical protein